MNDPVTLAQVQAHRRDGRAVDAAALGSTQRHGVPSTPDSEYLSRLALQSEQDYSVRKYLAYNAWKHANPFSMHKETYDRTTWPHVEYDELLLEHVERELKWLSEWI